MEGCSKRPERFRDYGTLVSVGYCAVVVLLVFVNAFLSVGSSTDIRNGCQMREAKKPLRIALILDAVVEVVGKKGCSKTRDDTENQANQEILALFRPDWRYRENRSIDNVDVADGRSFCDASLLVFLQQEGVDVTGNLGQAGVSGKITLFNRNAPEFALIGRKTLLDVRLLFGEVVQAGNVGIFDLLLDLVDLGLDILDGRMVCGILDQKRTLLDLEGGQLLGHFSYQRIIFHDGRRVRLPLGKRFPL